MRDLFLPLQNGGANRLRVCYQQGPLRLVSKLCSSDSQPGPDPALTYSYISCSHSTHFLHSLLLPEPEFCQAFLSNLAQHKEWTYCQIYIFYFRRKLCIIHKACSPVRFPGRLGEEVALNLCIVLIIVWYAFVICNFISRGQTKSSYTTLSIRIRQDIFFFSLHDIIVHALSYYTWCMENIESYSTCWFWIHGNSIFNRPGVAGAVL